MITSGHELLELCEKENKSISEVIIEDQIKALGLTREELFEKMRVNLNVMKRASKLAVEEDVKSVSGLLGGDAKKINERNLKGDTICGDRINRAMARALSCLEVNSSMGRIVAAPTAGSCGILPAVVITVAEINNSSEEDMIKALFTASAVGGIIAHNATVSGAEGGCQAECGSASAMAAAAAVELSHGNPEMSLDAAAITLKCILGLVCDPVAGLVESPCAKRNAMGAVNAMAAADMALSGIKSIIPFDEMVTAMYKVGRSMPCELKETALGGTAATPTAIEISKKIFEKD